MRKLLYEHTISSGLDQAPWHHEERESFCSKRAGGDRVNILDGTLEHAEKTLGVSDPCEIRVLVHLAQSVIPSPT